MRKRLILAATVLLALLGLGAVPATAAATAAHHTVASAAPASGPRNCPEGDVCIFSGVNFTGAEKDIAVTVAGCFDNFPFMPKSAINNLTTPPFVFDVTFFPNTNCTGTKGTFLEEGTKAGLLSSPANSFMSTAS